MSETYTELGAAIERRRAELQMSKADLQKATAISPNTYYRLLSGNIGQISLRTMNKLSKVLGISLTSLLSNDPSFGLTDDYAVVKSALATALDKYLEAELRKISSPKLVRLYERAFLGIMFEAYEQQHKSIGNICIPDTIARRDGMKFAVQVFPSEKSPLSPTCAVLLYDMRMNIKLGLENGRLHCITDKRKLDHFGYCYWDDARGIVRIDRITHGATSIEIEYSHITYICDIIMLIY